MVGSVKIFAMKNLQKLLDGGTGFDTTK